MNAKEIIGIVKESEPWALLTGKEKREAIKHAVKNPHRFVTEDDIKTTVGEVYSEMQETRRKSRR